MPIKFDVLNRWTRDVQFTAEIDCDWDAPRSVKLGLAVMWGFANGAKLAKANLHEANLCGARLNGANLYEANLRGADLREASLDGASLRGADLREASLDRANLYRASLRGASLDRADLREANLDGASLRGADLREASLDRANLDGASLREASLDRANLYRASLRGANLCGASLNGTIGDNSFVRTIQTPRWITTYTASQMQIGCQNHAIADWWSFGDATIGNMDCRALEWWRTWKPILLQIVAAAPCKPTGYVALENSEAA